MPRRIVICPSCELNFLSSRRTTICPGCHRTVEPREAVARAS